MLKGMKALLSLLMLAAVAAAAGDTPAPTRYQELPPGRYAVSISGLLCTVCARALAAELAKVPEIEKASADFNKEQAIIDVRLDKTMEVNLVYKAMRRAERLSNMGGKFELRGIRYIP